jgi:hypothetical protein
VAEVAPLIEPKIREPKRKQSATALLPKLGLPAPLVELAMPKPLPQKPVWYRTFTLRERVTLLRSLSSPPDRKTGDFERAERRLAGWRAQPPFHNPTLFAQRLASDEINEADLRYILADPPSLVPQSSAIPNWFRNISAAFSAASSIEETFKYRQAGVDALDFMPNLWFEHGFKLRQQHPAQTSGPLAAKNFVPSVSNASLQKVLDSIFSEALLPTHQQAHMP